MYLLFVVRVFGVVLNQGEHIVKNVVVPDFAERDIFLSAGDEAIKGIAVLVVKAVREVGSDV